MVLYTNTRGAPRRVRGSARSWPTSYLHYVLDLWVRQLAKRTARGSVRLVRFADDYLLLFEHQADAQQMLIDLPTRLAKFGFSLHDGKTRLVEFGRFAASQ
jgi:RNA-directed DNA polymerase